MPGGGWNRLKGDNVFGSHYQPTTCTRCGNTWPLWYFMFRDPYIRRDYCVLCQVEDEKQELKDAMLERKLWRAEKRRRKDLKRRIKNFQAFKKRRRDYVKKQRQKEGVQRYIK